MKKFEVISVVHCDEIRREANGASIILGAKLTGEPVTEDVETKLARFSLYIEAVVGDIESVKLRLYNDDDNHVAFSQDLDFSDRPTPNDLPDEAEDIIINVILAISSTQVIIVGPGIYNVQFKVPGEKWKTCKEIMFPHKEEIEA